MSPPPGPTPPEDLDDDALVARCRAGEQTAWRALVRRYERLVYTVPRRAGLSAEASADVFQACFSRLFTSLDRLQDGSRIRAWLVTTARRETLRVLAGGPAAGSTAEIDDELIERLPDDRPLPPDELDALQQQHRVREAVQRLDERSRRFVEVVFLQDEPPGYDEISRTLGIPVGSIGPTRSRVLAKLRALLGER